MQYTLSCKKCGLSFWGKGTYCGNCDPKRNKNPFSLLKSRRNSSIKMRSKKEYEK